MPAVENDSQGKSSAHDLKIWHGVRVDCAGVVVDLDPRKVSSIDCPLPLFEFACPDALVPRPREAEVEPADSRKE